MKENWSGLESEGGEISRSAERREFVMGRPEVNDAELFDKYRLSVYSAEDRLSRLQEFGAADDAKDGPQEERATPPLKGTTVSLLVGNGLEEVERNVRATVVAAGGSFVTFDVKTIDEVDYVLTDSLMHPPHVAMAAPDVCAGMALLKQKGTLCVDLAWLTSTVLAGKIIDEDLNRFLMGRDNEVMRVGVRGVDGGFLDVGDYVEVGGGGREGVCTHGLVTKFEAVTDGEGKKWTFSMRALEWHEPSKSLIDPGEGGLVLSGCNVEKVKRSINVMRLSELAIVSDGWGLNRDGAEKGMEGGGRRQAVFRLKRKSI